MNAVFQFRMAADQLPGAGQVQQILDLDDESLVELSPLEDRCHVWFARPAPSLADAIVSAALDLERVGLRPSWVGPRDPTSLPEAAARLGRPAEEFQAWFETTLSEPGAPQPFAMYSPGSGPTYRFDDIAAWVRTRLDPTADGDQPLLTAAGLALQLRQSLHALTGAEHLITALIKAAR